MRLSDISSKTSKKCIFCVFRSFLSLCWPASQPYDKDFKKVGPICWNLSYKSQLTKVWAILSCWLSFLGRKQLKTAQTYWQFFFFCQIDVEISKATLISCKNSVHKMDIDCWLLVQSTTGEVARSFSKRPYWITRCYTIFGLIYSGTAVFLLIYTSMTYENSLGFARYRISQKPTVFNTEILFLHYILEKMAISILFTYKPYQRNNLFCQLYLYDLWRT